MPAGSPRVIAIFFSCDMVLSTFIVTFIIAITPLFCLVPGSVRDVFILMVKSRRTTLGTAR